MLVECLKIFRTKFEVPFFETKRSKVNGIVTIGVGSRGARGAVAPLIFLV